MIKQQEQGFVEECLSNLTSPISCEASVTSSSNNNSNNIYHHQQYLPQLQHQDCEEPPAKKKRNLPGKPDPESEVIALSPKTLVATNRFVCEVCKKGFQRDQNLQLHRRGHNLPWKLKQRSKSEVIKKKVYVCPEKTCVHHHPSRALGDLTGIKKHFSRKHGGKNYKCDKCSKRYAVLSDWKAHSKVCGTREYTCDCGTLFSRRDSFITHRAFCDALAEESARAIPSTQTQTQTLITNTIPNGPSNLINIVPPWLACPSPSPSPSIFQHRDHQNPITGATPPHMSATALLQKAAQMGATISKNNTPHVTGMFGLTLPSRDQLSCGSGPGPNINPSSSSSSSSSFLRDMVVNSISSSYDDAFGIGTMISNNNNNNNNNNKKNDNSSLQTFYRTIGGRNDGLTRDFFGI